MQQSQRRVYAAGRLIRTVPERLEILHTRSIESRSALPMHMCVPLPRPPARSIHYDTQRNQPVRGSGRSAVTGRCAVLQALRSSRDAQKTSWVLPDTVRGYRVVHDLRQTRHAHTSTIPIYFPKVSFARPSFFFSHDRTSCISISSKSVPATPAVAKFCSVVGRLPCVGACLSADWRLAHEAACNTIPCSPRHCGNVATPSRYPAVA